jgi:glucose-1-phosphate cytidylyltransferase
MGAPQAVRVADIPVVILCGGQGTRIRDVAEHVPKPMIDIGGQPILWHIMKLYGHHGFRRFILCLGYKSWSVKEYFLHYRERTADFTIRLGHSPEPQILGAGSVEDWEVTCVETGLHAGTGARIAAVGPHIDTPLFCVTYGDGIGDVDLTALLHHHLECGRIGTVTAVRPTSRFGEMRTDDPSALVTEFSEKPSSADGWVSGGFFVFQREFLDYLPDDPGLFLEQGPLQKLTADGQLSMFGHTSFWRGMDTYREYVELNHLWDSDQAPWRQW